MLAAAAWIWCHGRRPPALIALSAGVVILCYVVYDTFVPSPQHRSTATSGRALGTLLLGLGLAVTPAVHRRIADSDLLRADGRHRSEPAQASA